MSLTHLVKPLGLLLQFMTCSTSQAKFQVHTHKILQFICLYPFPFPFFLSAAKQIPLKRRKKIFPFYPIFSHQPNKSVPANKIKKKSKISFQPYFLSYSQLRNQSRQKNIIFSPQFFSNQTNQYQPKLEKKSHTFPVDFP